MKCYLKVFVACFLMVQVLIIADAVLQGNPSQVNPLQLLAGLVFGLVSVNIQMGFAILPFVIVLSLLLCLLSRLLGLGKKVL